MTYTPKILTREEWGAHAWRSQMFTVDITARDYRFNHWHGGAPRHDRGIDCFREIEAIHLANGWSGVGYNWMVGQDGVIGEGRGWNLVGAHCPNFNTRGIGVYFAVGGDKKLTDEAKAAGVWLYQKHLELRKKAVTLTYHGAHYPTECAGKEVIAWTGAGMPLSGKTLIEPPKIIVPQPGKIIVSPRPAVKLNLDGKLGENTITALQKRLCAAGYKTAVDGDNGPSTTKALQRYLNAKLGGTDLLVDGVGFAQDGREYKTVRALQRWLGTPQDGKLSMPSSLAVKRLQDRLNRGNF